MIGTRSMSFSCLVLVYIASLYCIRADFEIKEEVIEKSTPGDCDRFFLVCRGLCVKGFKAKCSSSYDKFSENTFNKDGCSCLCKGGSNLIPTTIQTTTTTTTTTTSFSQTLLESHNYYRSLHGVPALTLSQDLINKAQKWAEYLAETRTLVHSKVRGLGENLYYARSSSGAPNGEKAVTSWYNEIKDYDFNNPENSDFFKTGHFTQVVWKSTSQLGCGRAFNGNNVYVVCNYLAPGNYKGEHIENVLPLLK